MHTKEEKTIYILLPKNDDLNRPIVDYLSKKIGKHLKVKIIICNKHIIESTLSNIDKEDIVFWNPNLAGDNLYLLRYYINSVVVLKHKSSLLNKKNKYNPITENMAINGNFRITYIDDSEDENNTNYSLILEENYYTFNFDKLNNL